MESENNKSGNQTDKRKLSEKESEVNDCKKIYLDPNGSNTTVLTEKGSQPTQENVSSSMPVDNIICQESPQVCNDTSASEKKEEKESPVSVSSVSQEKMILNPKDVKNNVTDKESPDVLLPNNSENKEILSPSSNSVNTNLKQKQDSDCLTVNKETSQFSSQSVSSDTKCDVDKKKLEEKDSCILEKEKEKNNIETTSDDKKLEGNVSKIDSTSDLGDNISHLAQNPNFDSLGPESPTKSNKKDVDELNFIEKEEKNEKSSTSPSNKDLSPLVSSDFKENLTFKGSLKNISLVSNIEAETNIKNEKCILPSIEKCPVNVESTFVPIPQSETASSDLGELDKKSEVSAMETESNNPTPIEGSLVETPCDSGETSPSTSTPADSCQVSAAPSPLLKEEPTVSESLLDDSSMDTKDIPDDNEEDKELESIRRVRFGRRRKKKLAQTYKKGKRKTTPMLVDEETRMSATRTPDPGIDEDSQSSVGTTSKKEPRRYKSEVIVPESTETFTAEKVYEYIWPLEGLGGEHYFIQEHISQYLGISSFKRRYPDLRRRAIESQEKEFLKDLGLVTEIACDLGLTAVRSEDMLDIMFNDFPSKYEELQRVLRERKEKQLKEKGKVEYQIVNLDKSKMKEYSRKAALNSSKWNASFNRERNEERRYCFDLQTFTLHMPTGRGVKFPSQATNLGSYPVAVLPGQYTDYCKKYTTNELKGMPIQSVLMGPFTAEELAAEMQEDSDDDDGSAIASVGTCPEFKEEPETTLPIDPLSAEKQPRCKVCNGGRGRNKDGKPEPLIICGTCRTPSHPTCIDLTLAMITKIESYSWQCMDCKTCAQCNDPDDEERMIFCDMCDRGYHIYCVGLRKVPNGRWHCKECAVCFTCGSRNPSGSEHIKNAEWQHEFKKDKDNKQLKYACTLCVPCDKYWKRRQFCAICMKVYRSIPEDGMVRCMGCLKYVHKDGCSLMHENERFCNFCYKSRNSTALSHSRIIAAAKKKMATGSPMWK